MDKYLSLLVLSVLTILGVPQCASADAGVPMLVVVWPAAWMLLLAIIPIEALIAFKVLKLDWKESFKIVTAANIASTLIGIPLTWVVLTALELFFDGGRAYGLNTDSQKLLAVTLQSPWLIPYEEDLN